MIEISIIKNILYRVEYRMFCFRERSVGRALGKGDSRLDYAEG